jgi:hypothetical protein
LPQKASSEKSPCSIPGRLRITRSAPSRMKSNDL